MPIPHQKGKPAVIIASYSTPWPLNFIAAESRGAIRAVHEVLHYGGYKIKGEIAVPGTRHKPQVARRILNKAKSTGLRF